MKVLNKLLPHRFHNQSADRGWPAPQSHFLEEKSASSPNMGWLPQLKMLLFITARPKAGLRSHCSRHCINSTRTRWALVTKCSRRGAPSHPAPPLGGLSRACALLGRLDLSGQHFSEWLSTKSEDRSKNQHAEELPKAVACTTEQCSSPSRISGFCQGQTHRETCPKTACLALWV